MCEHASLVTGEGELIQNGHHSLDAPGSVAAALSPSDPPLGPQPLRGHHQDTPQGTCHVHTFSWEFCPVWFMPAHPCTWDTGG